MDIFLTVLGQVGIMMIMMAVGWLLFKKRVLTDVGASEMTKVLVNIVTPCLIISSFATVDSGDISVYNVVLSIVLALASILIGIIVSKFLFKKQDEGRKNVLRFGVAFSNSGFMGMPLVESILGAQGLIYASFFIVVFNIICWTYGYSMMGGKGKIRIRTLLFNPGVIGTIFGLPIYIFGLDLPNLVLSPISSFGALNTPLAMIIAGACIAKLNLNDFIEDLQVYKMAFFKLLAVPLIVLGLVFLINPEDTLFVSIVIQSCTPTATATVLLAMLFNKDSRLASKAVAISTLISIVTIPFVITFAQILAKIN